MPELPSIGNALRGMAKRIDPSPSETMVLITQQGKDRAAQLLGKSQLGLILNHLVEFSPQSVTEIAHNCEMDLKFVKRNVEAYPHFFEVRTR